MIWKIILCKCWFLIINFLFIIVNNCERIYFFIYRIKFVVWVIDNYKCICICLSVNSFLGIGFSSEDNVVILMI